MAANRRHVNESSLEKLANNVPGGLFQLRLDPGGHFSVPFASKNFIDLLGLSEADRNINPSEYLRFIHTSDLPTYLRHIRTSAKDLVQWSCEFRYHRSPGELCWIMVKATPEKLPDGGIVWHGHISDITERKTAEATIAKLAFNDGLTGLPNRQVFVKQLDRTIDANARTGAFGALMFIDLDNFKTLNDTHGHEVGDILLVEVAKRLKECVRSDDIVSRFGGDEFMILIGELGSDRSSAITSASGVANKIISAFARGFDLGTIQHAASPSIGTVVFGDTIRSATEIMRSADIAMYEAKKNGRNRFVLFGPSDLNEVTQLVAMQNQLKEAIETDQLYFEYQPQVDANGAIGSCEALLRWQHPERGRILPSVFVPLAERSGLISNLNSWVIRNAVRTLARWKADAELRSLSLAVNVSALELRSPVFAADVGNLLAEYGIDGSRLTLELTEHAMARNPQEISAQMNILKRAGLRLSLDDFGTGNASITQINRFPFDEVKIDGVFVSDLEKSHAHRSLIEAILGMAQALGIETVAEHVGNHKQAEFLKNRGCRRFQGFLYHPPMNETELRALLTNDTQRQLRAG